MEKIIVTAIICLTVLGVASIFGSTYQKQLETYATIEKHKEGHKIKFGITKDKEEYNETK